MYYTFLVSDLKDLSTHLPIQNQHPFQMAVLFQTLNGYTNVMLSLYCWGVYIYAKKDKGALTHEVKPRRMSNVNQYSNSNRPQQQRNIWDSIVNEVNPTLCFLRSTKKHQPTLPSWP